MWICNYSNVFFYFGFNGMCLKNVILVCFKICFFMICYIEFNKIVFRVNYRVIFILVNKIIVVIILVYVNFFFY